MENLFDALFYQSQLPKFICDRKAFHIMDVNAKASEIYGYTREEFLQMSIYDLRVPEEHDQVKSIADQCVISPEVYAHHITKSGLTLDVKVALNKVVYRGVDAMLGVVTNISNLVSLQEELLFSEKRFKSLINNGHEMIGIIDPVGTYLYVSDNVRRIIKLEPEALLGINAFERIHPDEAQAVFEQLAIVHGQEFMEVRPFRFKAGDGTWRWIECSVANCCNDPAIGGLVVNTRDITEKKETQDRLERLSKIAEETVNAVIITDAEGRITWVNKAFQTISGYDLLETIGKKPSQVLQGEESSDEAIAYMSQRLSVKQRFETEIINYTKNSKPYWVHIQCQPQFNENNEVVSYFAILTDITERKTLEQKLNTEIVRRQHKVTSAIVKAQERERKEIGRELHDNVNQMLSAVKLYLSIAGNSTADQQQLLDKCSSLVQECIDEIRGLTRRIVNPHINDMSLDESIRELIADFSIAGNIKFTFRPYNVGICELDDEVQLAIYRIVQEHLTNVIRHSRANTVEIVLAYVVNNLNLRIYDDGIGFDVQQKKSGIGISNMMNRAQTIDGKLQIVSTPGNGCTLMATFPNIKSKTSKEPARVA